MESFVAAGFLHLELAQLNRCQLFLQVTFLSKICTASGERILPECYSQPTQHFRQSKLIWPTQQSPGASQWRLWRQALDGLVRGQDLFLRSSLGPWRKVASHLDQHWAWYWDHVRHLLHHEGRNHSVLSDARSTCRLKFSVTRECAEPVIDDCVPVDVNITAEFFSMAPQWIWWLLL